MTSALLVYESLFGNTRKIADAIADGLRQECDVVIRPAGTATAEDAYAADLVVVGGPTHAFGLASRRTREAGVKDAAPESLAEATGVESGVREWLEQLPQSDGTKRAAAFDTRFNKPRIITGGASRGIYHRLRRLGYRFSAPPESFLVSGMTGPLVDSEAQRARDWGAGLAASKLWLTGPGAHRR
jgi:hypothetical protein